MVCIAAFIILAIIGIFVAFISIFKPKVGKAYLKALKKSWGCLWKKVRLQKCETGFKDDVKNGLLSRVIIKHPTWVKPLSVVIEVLSVVIVVVAVWAIITAIKSLLALYALGTCNVTKAEACTLGAEVCSIDESETDGFFEGVGRWFTEWGEIFEAIPDKFKTYRAEDYDFGFIPINITETEGLPVVVDIFDPGCVVCMKSYRNQKESGYFDERNVRLVPFAIQGADGEFKFKNSDLVVRFMFAAEKIESGASLIIIDKIFTERNSEGISYQDKFNFDYSNEEATKKIESWLMSSGIKETDLKKIRELIGSDEINEIVSKNKNIVEKELKVKGIPTMVYDGKKHTGLWKENM